MADYEKFRSQSQAADLSECTICGRKFMSESLQRHEPICAKAAEKKRKPFDSSKQRIEGTEIATVKVPGKAKAAVERELAPRKNGWRQKHAEFINTLHAARGVKKALENGLPLPPPPPPVVNPDYVQCPTCNRHFNETAAQRHMAFCAEQSRRLPIKKEISQETAQRNVARTQYKPPKLKGKTQPNDLSRYQSAGPTLQNGSSVRSTGSSKQTLGRTDASPARDGYGYNDQVDARKQYKPSSANSKQQPAVGTYNQLYGGSALPSSDSTESIGSGSTRSGSQRRPGIRETAKEIPSPSADGRPPLGPLQRVQQQQQQPPGGYSSSSSSRRMNSAGSGDSPTTSSKRPIQQQRGMMLSKFCHECGNRFCKDTAAYCCECGTKRMEL